MASLISADDRFVMKNTRFVKNACFYKDMFAFYDAYEQILKTPKDKLPNYLVLPNGNICLEGVCLLMKNYASELNFESLRLTLDYLKVIYYTIASFSNNENMPTRAAIEAEFAEFQKASKALSVSAAEELETAEVRFDDAKHDYEKHSAKYAKQLIGSNISNVFSIILLIFSFGFGAIPFMIYSFGKLSLFGSSIMTCFAVALGFAIYFVLKNVSKNLEEAARETAYLLQQKKKIKDEYESLLNAQKAKCSKILSEKYEYKTNFAEAMKPYVKKLEFSEIMSRAFEYKLVSYNFKLDIENLFKTEQQSVEEISKKLERLPKNYELMQSLNEIYDEIYEKDYLYFNNEVRFSFLKKFSENAEKFYSWKLDRNGEKVNPFGVNIKAIAKERIAYLKDNDSLFVSASLDKFLNTNYIKNLNKLELKGISSNESLKNVKFEFMSHFYSLEKTQMFDNLFYDKKMVDGAKVSYEIREDAQKIPTFVLLKLKAIECKLGLENSNFEIISQIASDIEKMTLDEKYEAQTVESSEADVLENDFKYEDFGDYIKYNVGGNIFVGYKLV